MLRWLRGGGAAALGWAAGLTLAVFVFRVHVFAVLALTNAMLFAAGWRPKRWGLRPAVVAAGLLLLGLVSWLSEVFPRAPHFWSGPRHPVTALGVMLGMRLSPHADLFKTVVASVHVGGALAQVICLGLGLGILLFAAFGALVLVYAAGLFAAIKRGVLVEDFVPLLAVLAYFVMVAAFPDTPHEPYEFAHRPFVFPYVMLAVWCARDAALWLRKAGARWRAVPMAVAMVLLIVPLALEGRAQSSLLQWRALFSALPVPQGVQAAAAYVRLNAGPGEVVAIPAGPLDEAFLALSERPTLSPGTVFLQLQSGISATDAAARQSELAQALAGQRIPGVDWVVTGDQVRRVGG
jgi:hypothetical protein